MTKSTDPAADMGPEMDEYSDYSDYSDDVSTFGDRIVAAREALGMSPHDLARRLGIKTQTLVNWEEDRSEPRANKLQMLAGVLNVSIIWLMTGTGPGVKVSLGGPKAEDIAELLAELRAVREAQSELANRTLRLERRLIAMVR